MKYIDIAPFCFIVYDEFHYFYTDANFNTYTDVSYSYLRECSRNKIQIFMSATMEKMKDIANDYWCSILKSTQRYLNQNNDLFLGKNNFIEYTAKKNYDYVRVHTFIDIDDLVELIRNSDKQKWLVFIDSKEKGKNLHEQLSMTDKREKGQVNAISNEDVVFIDAFYDSNVEASQSVDELNESKIINKRVVIATSVLDNGISFQDALLRNIAILADTEEEFIQMLGRKREDKSGLDLYISRRNENHFKKRYNEIKNIMALHG